jgi:hypothetical protein
LRYGQRVVVLAMPCPDVWHQPAGLELVGPRAFGLDLDYHPLVTHPSEPFNTERPVVRRTSASEDVA